MFPGACSKPWLPKPIVRALTAHQVGQLLGHGSRWETESFLKRVHACLHYSEDDLERDIAALRSARGG